MPAASVGNQGENNMNVYQAIVLLIAVSPIVMLIGFAWSNKRLGW